MKSNKPYLIRALYEWIVDNDLTPYLLVNVAVPGCEVPQAHVSNGHIVFNVTMDVVHNLVLGDEAITFAARFSGVSTPIYIPIAAVAAIYAKENGEGMAFSEEELQAEASTKPKAKPDLKIVK